MIPVPLDLDSGYVIELNDGDRTMGMWRELTFPTNSLKNSVLVIEDERANILTDPLRWRILEILGDGKSVAEISQVLGDTDARILYHLQQLVQTGVVHLEEDGADPRNGAVCQRQIQFAFERPFQGMTKFPKPYQLTLSASSIKHRSKLPKGCMAQHSRWQSITTGLDYLKNRQPNLVADCWRL